MDAEKRIKHTLFDVDGINVRMKLGRKNLHFEIYVLHVPLVLGYSVM